MAQPLKSVGLLALLAYSVFRRRPVQLLVVGTLVPLLETYLASCVESMGGYLVEEPVVLGICRVQRAGEFTEVTLPKSLADVPSCNHFMPLVHVDARASERPHSHCGGRRCGGSRGWPCISGLTEAVAPLGFLPWPVPGDGDCFFHSVLWLEGQETLGVEGLAQRSQLRRELAHLLGRQVHSALWSDMLPLLDEDAPIEAVPAPCPPVTTPVRIPPTPAPVLVDDDGLLFCDPVFDLMDDEGGNLGEEDGHGDTDALDEDADAMVAAVSKAYKLTSAEDLLMITSVVASFGPAERDTAMAMITSRSETDDALLAMARASEPFRDPGIMRVRLQVAERRKIGEEFSIHCKKEGFSIDDRLPKFLMDQWWQNRFHRPIKHAEKMLLLRCRRLSANPEAKLSPEKTKNFAQTLKLGPPMLGDSIDRSLFKWFCSIRGSVKGRIPLKLLHAQYHRIRSDYLGVCLRQGLVPKIPASARPWIQRFRKRHCISLRLPNKRWKVPMVVFKERLRILWCNLVRVRYAIFLIFKYWPDIDSWDQKPFHFNEAQSELFLLLAY